LICHWFVMDLFMD